MAFPPERRGGGTLVPRSRQQPIAPVEPPASLSLLGCGHERVRTGRVDRPDHEGGFLIGRRIEEALEVSAVRKHEGRPLTYDLRGLVHPFPGRDVVGYAGDDVAVDLDSAHGDCSAVQREL